MSSEHVITSGEGDDLKWRFRWPGETIAASGGGKSKPIAADDKLVHPAYVTMLGHLRSKTLERFKTCLEQSLHRGERYAVSVRYCNRAYMLEFDQGCAACSLRSHFHAREVCSGLTSADNFGAIYGNDSSQYSIHLRSCLLSRQSTNNSLDNKARPMANTNQAPDLESIHCEMHGIFEQIRIMNEINSHLMQHLAINNPPPATAPLPEDADRSHRSFQSGDQDLQNCHSAGQGHSTRSCQHQSASLHSKRGKSHGMSESRSFRRTQDTMCEKTRRRGRSPRWDDRVHRRRNKSTTQKIKDLDAWIDAINTGIKAPVIMDALIRQTEPPFTKRAIKVKVSSRFNYHLS
ncbi:root hair defective 3 GTP-binding protein [Actinidia rufa]|uniref:Root hair defective 3 GTP-binding protein n=1 Tax=Actinidia rufa TaxID=165716 RepID=A0A7J0F9L0_9ERIC|nr:root hair defective 3 GTP-binding protein [Actinidia rufa]